MNDTIAQGASVLSWQGGAFDILIVCSIIILALKVRLKEQAADLEILDIAISYPFQWELLFMWISLLLAYLIIDQD